MILFAPFRIDLSPFEVIDFRRNFKNEKEGFIAMKNKLLDIGFVFDEKTNAQWQDYLAESDL